MARLVKTDGTIEFLEKAPLGLAAWQAIVGGYIELVHLPDGGLIICNEEGKIMGLPLNQVATELWHRADQRAQGADVLCGQVLFFTPEDAKQMEGDE